MVQMYAIALYLTLEGLESQIKLMIVSLYHCFTHFGVYKTEQGYFTKGVIRECSFAANVILFKHHKSDIFLLFYMLHATIWFLLLLIYMQRDLTSSFIQFNLKCLCLKIGRGTNPYSFTFVHVYFEATTFSKGSNYQHGNMQ